MADLPVPPPAPANPVQNQPANPNPADPQCTCSKSTCPSNTCSKSNCSGSLSDNTSTSTKLVKFEPEIAGRPEEDVETHLPFTNVWMITNNFPEDMKVQRFCLSLTGEARLWYESLTPIANNWLVLQKNFRKQYSKIGNTREQLLHAWRSFHYGENTETIDAYVNRIRQVAAMLGYGELQILEVFKNTILNRLYWTLFPIDNLRVAFETAKRVLTKEKIDRQMSDHSSATPFMRVNNEHNYSTMKSCKKGVTFMQWKL